MRLIVWGLGYVGTVSATAFAKLGHEVIGVEPNSVKVDALNSGKPAIKEPGLQSIARSMVECGRLRATQHGFDFLKWADVSLICVGTPSAPDGSPLLEHLRVVATEIGKGLKDTKNYHVVALRSTVFPGTSRHQLIPILEQHSGKKAGSDFGVVMNPEFLRETSAIADFWSPPYTIIGEHDRIAGDLVERLYKGVDAPVHRVNVEEAEFLKLVNNAFHALKIGFSNEIGRLSDKLGVDANTIMNLVCADTKLNVSTAYLHPGFAFGGSCLPKDLRSLSFNAHRSNVKIPIIDSVLVSNSYQIEAARVKINELGVRTVGVLGLSFKPGTDDLRESPVITLIRDLWQDGMDVMVYDPDVQPETMLGSNLEYLNRQLPQIHQILKPNLEDVLDGCDAIVITQKRAEYLDALDERNNSKPIVNLVSTRVPPSATEETLAEVNPPI